jgi:hypothetical protein
MHSRRTVLAGAASLAASTFWTPRADGTPPEVLPHPKGVWADALKIIGPDRLSTRNWSGSLVPELPHYCDFGICQNSIGQWHVLGFQAVGTLEQPQMDRLFHFCSDRLTGPYRQLPPVDFGYDRRSIVSSPYFLHLGSRTLMFYDCIPPPRTGDSTSIRIATPNDVGFEHWVEIAALHDRGRRNSRDPHVIWDESSSRFLMYYASTIVIDGTEHNEITARTSSDAISWTDPITVLGTPPGYEAPESPFVLERDGTYYMWISAASDWSRMSLYASRDPLHFGDVTADRIEEQPGHACEIVQAGGRDWMACVAIATRPGLGVIRGLPERNHDLVGVYLQPLIWRQRIRK